jgi:hypothetical protein
LRLLVEVADMENKLLWVAATGVDHVVVPKDASGELVRVVARAVCSAFGAVLYKGDTIEFPRQFAQSIASFRTRAWRAGPKLWTATLEYDRSQQRSLSGRRLRPDEPDPRAVMDLLVGRQECLPWEAAVAVRNTFGHAFLRDRLDHNPDLCGICDSVVAGRDGDPAAWDDVLGRLDADWTLALDLYGVLRSGEPPACPLLVRSVTEVGPSSPAVDSDGHLLYPL